MGICNASNEGRLIRLTNQKMNKLKDSKEVIKRNKNFNEFKINEIKCANFYNINNNYNYSISNNDNNEQNDETIKGLKLINQPIENLFQEKDINEEIYLKLLSYFNSKVNLFPYNKISQEQILQNENDYAEHKIISPYKYIEMKNYGKLFNKIYELCFLKCEPLLNNINDDKKAVNLLFYRSVIVLLREKTLEKTSEDIINSIIEFAFDDNSRYINKNKFCIIIKSFCEICHQILFYFFIAYNQFTDEQYYGYLSDKSILMNDKYSNVDIDIFSLNIIYGNDKGNNKLEEIEKQWSNFICENVNYEELNYDNLNKNNNNFSFLKNKIKEMINYIRLFEVLSCLKFPNL